MARTLFIVLVMLHSACLALAVPAQVVHMVVEEIFLIVWFVALITLGPSADPVN
jgi:hypothetical protein